MLTENVSFFGSSRGEVSILKFWASFGWILKLRPAQSTITRQFLEQNCCAETVQHLEYSWSRYASVKFIPCSFQSIQIKSNEMMLERELRISTEQVMIPIFWRFELFVAEILHLIASWRNFCLLFYPFASVCRSVCVSVYEFLAVWVCLRQCICLFIRNRSNGRASVCDFSTRTFIPTVRKKK